MPILGSSVQKSFKDAVWVEVKLLLIRGPHPIFGTASSNSPKVSSPTGERYALLM